MTAISLAAGDAHKVKADAIVVGIAQGTGGTLVLAPGARDVDSALKGRLLATLTSLGASGKVGECHRVATLGATVSPVVVAVGLGTSPRRGHTFDAETIRRCAGAATRSLAGTRRVALSLPVGAASGATGISASGPTAAGNPSTGDGVRAIAEGALLGNYSYLRYRHA
ncbi:MAG: M17 family peptidase N-terminal domain-containing protein, partial [Trebonia sp.]